LAAWADGLHGASSDGQAPRKQPESLQAPRGTGLSESDGLCRAKADGATTARLSRREARSAQTPQRPPDMTCRVLRMDMKRATKASMWKIGFCPPCMRCSYTAA